MANNYKIYIIIQNNYILYLIIFHIYGASLFAAASISARRPASAPCSPYPATAPLLNRASLLPRGFLVCRECSSGQSQRWARHSQSSCAGRYRARFFSPRGLPLAGSASPALPDLPERGPWWRRPFSPSCRPGDLAAPSGPGSPGSSSRHGGRRRRDSLPCSSAAGSSWTTCGGRPS